MGIGQGVAHGRGDRERLGCRQAASALEPLAQRSAVDVRHDVVKESARLARVVQGEDVRVGQARRDLDLLQEPLDPEEGREPGEEDLQGDIAVVFVISGQVHGGHTTAAEHAAELVALGERGLKVGGKVRRHGGRI